MIFREVLAQRSRVLFALRHWFEANGFLEVETPVRIPAPALEPHIDAEPAGTWYLRTSPELHMKRLLGEGAERIFQIGPCFRRGERGRLHHPEFTMLEWYRANTDYLGVLEDARRLLQAVVQEVTGSLVIRGKERPLNVSAPWVVVGVGEAFREAAGWDPRVEFDPDRFDLDLVNRVEPWLPRDRPVVLRDYPLAVGALARRKAEDPRVAERWELYLGGMEIANAFSELTDASEQRARFEACAAERRRNGKPVYPLDEEFLDALKRGLPPCGGVALGVDRLVMLLTGADSIAEVRPFCGDAVGDGSDSD